MNRPPARNQRERDPIPDKDWLDDNPIVVDVPPGEPESPEREIRVPD